ncbi:glycosyltransferase [Leptolyngbya sp. FACHB-16]|uniref:glycosyltransferase n=1 Tax=unclassified Leptolyngbya TaxID=2650499 RepID=UPI0016848F6F|nr:glycosyltransferase [Leptolyngbya sp. FACHB-16]MBD2157203.1 glycosyltransferase [Leptolyngbya sp. FACHB-16]
MKISIVTSGFLPVIDGVTVTVAERIKRLSTLGHSVQVLCPDYQAIATVYPNWQDYVGNLLPGVQVVSLPSEPFMGVEFERNISGKAGSALEAAIQSFQPDIIHVDEPDRIFLGLGSIPAVKLAKRDRIPCVSFYHTNFLEYMEDFLPLPTGAIAPLRWLAKHFITRRVYNAYDATLVASPTTLHKVQHWGLHNAVYGPFLGVDPVAFGKVMQESNFWQTHYGLPDLSNSLKLLFLGRLTPDKGWGFLLKALSGWEPQGASTRKLAVIIAGDGELKQKIGDRLQQSGIAVYFLGRVPPEQVPALLAHSDIHVSASRKETWGLTALEASAAGIPVLAPRAGGFIDSVQDEKTGLLFEPENSKNFLTKLQRLADDPALRHALGQQGRHYANELNWDRAVDALVQFWQSRIDAYATSRP